MPQSSLRFAAPRPRGAPAVVEGAVERIVFASPETAWCVLRLKVAGRRGMVTAVGDLFGVQPGETVRLTGHWQHDRRYGEQLRVESFLTVRPSTLAGLEKYLGSGLVPGIGPVMAKRLVGHFGLETLDVIDHQPERLREVEGIGSVRSERIRAAWAEQKEIQQVMVFLQTHGISPRFAVKIYRRYGEEAVRVVTEDPFRLATDVHGIGFRTADRIAADLGVPSDSPRRVEAGLLHVLGEASNDGHVYLPRTALLERAVALLEVPEAATVAALTALAGDERVTVEGDREGAAVYLKPLHVAEAGLARRLGRLLASPAPPLSLDLERAWEWFEERHGLALADEQKEALRVVATNRVAVVTGGPGTGKTTLVRAIVAIFSRKGQRIALAAPTGRAAKRMAEATGAPAVTLHRLLEFAPQSLRFERNAERPLAVDLLVVDEVSMVDVVLGHHLLAAVPPTARIVLVGDADQLPSVGPGAVLGELIASGRVPVVRLQRIFRQAARSLIVRNAHRVLRGDLPRLPAREHRSDFYFVAREDADLVLETVRRLVAVRIPRRFGFDPLADVQVLSPMRRGVLGTTNLNHELQEALNATGAAVGMGRFRVGDKVMQTRNNYDLDVFNGDLGRIESVDADSGDLLVRCDDRLVRYATRDADDLELAYACSIHKSQGSEYPCVVLVLHGQHHVLLQRNLLYTGLTRGKRLVVLVGSRRAVAQAARTGSRDQRFTRLGERLRDAASGAAR